MPKRIVEKMELIKSKEIKKENSMEIGGSPKSIIRGVQLNAFRIYNQNETKT